MSDTLKVMSAKQEGSISMPDLLDPGVAWDQDSHGFFTLGGVKFEVRICDPRPTFYLWIPEEHCHLFPGMKPRRR